MARVDQLIAAARGASGRPAPARSPGLALALAASVGLHAALLVGQASRDGFAPSASVDAAPMARLAVRFTAAQVVPTQALVAPAVAVPPKPVAHETPADVPASHRPDPALLASVARATLQPEAVPVPPMPATAPPVVPLAGTMPMAAAPEGYLMRSALTRPPVPITEIDLAWPRGMLPSGRMTGIFWLYISDVGTVDRFTADDSNLPPQLEDLARSAFTGARFEPGEVDGRPAKSLIRIEVVFDNRPSSVPMPSITSERTL